MRLAFNKLDTDESGGLEPAELEKLKKNGKKMNINSSSSAEVFDPMHEFDIDGNDSLDLRDYTSAENFSGL